MNLGYHNVFCLILVVLWSTAAPTHALNWNLNDYLNCQKHSRYGFTLHSIKICELCLVAHVAARGSQYHLPLTKILTASVLHLWVRSVHVLPALWGTDRTRNPNWSCSQKEGTPNTHSDLANLSFANRSYHYNFTQFTNHPADSTICTTFCRKHSSHTPIGDMTPLSLQRRCSQGMLLFTPKYAPPESKLTVPAYSQSCIYWAGMKLKGNLRLHVGECIPFFSPIDRRCKESTSPSHVFSWQVY